ncbi:MAG: hypothetical protein REI11_10075 [Patulibacter sp.]|nr:hypothetical protein [Patulibacter sp.]
MLDGVVEGRTPEIWALERLLALGGVEVVPSMALGLAGGAGFVATIVKGARRAPARLHVSGWNSFQTDLVGAIDRLGMVRRFDETSNRRGAVRALDEAFAAGGPVAIWVDATTIGLGTGVTPGPLVVLAEPRGDGTADVTGPAAGGEVARVVVDLQALSAARDAIPALRNRLLTVQPPTEERARAIRGGLATMAVGSIGGPRGRTGPEGVERLARAITGRGFGDWRTAFDGGWPLLAALSTLAAAIRAEQGLLRAAQACFERTAAEELDIPPLREVAAAHDALAAGWLEVADLALPPGMPALERTRATAPTAEALRDVHDDTFPINRAELDAILSGTAARVASLAADESAALELLRTTLRTH